MRNCLPKNCNAHECGILNLDDDSGSGTHWCAYYKLGNKCHYFDSFGYLRPPKEFVNYVGSGIELYYNYKRYQRFNTFNCGHLCLEFLLRMQDQNLI